VTGPARLCIEGELTIVRAAALHAELLPLLEREPSLDIDLSAVSEIDSAGLQLLLLAKRSTLAQGKELRLLGHSPVVLELLQLFNLSDYFGDSQLVVATDEAQP
jgi:anti-anti-sigma factor